MALAVILLVALAVVGIPLAGVIGFWVGHDRGRQDEILYQNANRRTTKTPYQGAFDDRPTIHRKVYRGKNKES